MRPLQPGQGVGLGIGSQWHRGFVGQWRQCRADSCIVMIVTGAGQVMERVR